MAAQTVFKRYELKYLLSHRQKERILALMDGYMQLDKYGRTTIRNIYFDTPDYRLIRYSIGKPEYKEKIRLRSYEKPNGKAPVFVELKKKYKKVVYKRRLAMPETMALDWLSGKRVQLPDTQIAREIDYFISYYKNLQPAVFLSYEREAYFAKDGSDFRVTFDDEVMFQQDDLTLGAPIHGESILPEGMVLMELKCSGGLPMWMVNILSAEQLYETSFSKYGRAYKNVIQPKLRENNTYARNIV